MSDTPAPLPPENFSLILRAREEAARALSQSVACTLDAISQSHLASQVCAGVFEHDHTITETMREAMQPRTYMADFSKIFEEPAKRWAEFSANLIPATSPAIMTLLSSQANPLSREVVQASVRHLEAGMRHAEQVCAQNNQARSLIDPRHNEANVAIANYARERHGELTRPTFLRFERPQTQTITKEKTYVFVVGGQTIESTEPVNRFIRVGTEWVFMFEGVPQSSGHYLGFSYIVHLLRNPHRRFSAWDLFRAVEGISDTDQMSSYQELYGKRELDGFREKRRKLETELELARRDNDPASVQRIRNEMSDFCQLVTASKDKKGKSKRFPDEHERARQSVGRAIQRAMDHLEAIHPALHQHLRSALHLRQPLAYVPDRDMHWEL